MTLNVFIDMGVDCVDKINESDLEKISDNILEISLIHKNNLKIYLDKDLYNNEEDLVIQELFDGKQILLKPLIDRFAAWQDYSPSSIESNYFQWQFQQETQVIENYNVICEVARRQNQNEKCFLMSCCPENNNIDPLYIIQNSNSSPKKANWSEIAFSDCISFEDLKNWIKTNAKDKIYDHNYKHPLYENPEKLDDLIYKYKIIYEKLKDKSNFRSPLLCSLERAKDLLENAVGEHGRSNLINYDKSTGLFIEFKKTNPHLDDTVYHAYHILFPVEFLKKVANDHGEEIIKILENRKNQG
ncbi:MAG: hypothetical protein KA146_00220 [Leptospiraceae bacterium]|nr:hypothetical protein [Leptospiraceae bacterium]